MKINLIERHISFKENIVKHPGHRVPFFPHLTCKLDCVPFMSTLSLSLKPERCHLTSELDPTESLSVDTMLSLCKCSLLMHTTMEKKLVS